MQLISLSVQQNNCVGTDSLSIYFAETTNSGFPDYFVYHREFSAVIYLVFIDLVLLLNLLWGKNHVFEMNL
jgi:hypothetical protein